MLRTQQIKIKKGHKMYSYFDDMCFNAKNLYNVGNFYTRQCLTGLKKDKLTPNEDKVINEVNNIIPELNNIKAAKNNKALLYEELSADNSFLGYYLLEGVLRLSNNPDYKALPAHVNQQVLKLLMRDWKSFFESIKDYKANPSKYKGMPKPPRYANKNGRKTAIFTNQVCKIKDNKYLRFPKTKLQLNIGKLGLIDSKLKEVRVVPGVNYYIIEVVLETLESDEVKTNREQRLNSPPKRVIGIDLGIDNLATIANNIGLQPMIIKGKVLKSINQYYNKERAYYYSILRQGKSQNEGNFTSRKLQSLDEKRNNKVKDYMHKASKIIINYCLENDIDTIVIGKNDNWKQGIDIGKMNNQQFTGIPHSRLIQMIEYKAYEGGIKVILTEESYTSKASFFDYDVVPKYSKDKNNYTFSGKRVKRGLYKTSAGLLVNADVNGALNIITKVIPDAFKTRDIGLVTSPQVLSIA